MRDAGPLQGDVLVRQDGGPVVELVEGTVAPAVGLRSDPLPRLGGVVGEHLELREHGLTVERALELAAEVVEEVGALRVVCRMVEQVAHEEHLVGGGRHLRHEHLVVGVARGLRLAGQVGVERVSHLVHQGEDVLQGAHEVEEDEGREAAATGGVGTARLARSLVHVDPALVYGTPHHGEVVLAQGRQGLEHEVAGLLEAVAALRHLDYGHVDVPVAGLLEAQGTGPQRHVAVHGGGVPVHGLDEGLIDGAGHLGGGEGGI